MAAPDPFVRPSAAALMNGLNRSDLMIPDVSPILLILAPAGSGLNAGKQIEAEKNRMITVMERIRKTVR